MTVEELTKLLWNIDPISFQACGAPENEYDIEAKAIFTLLSNKENPSVDEITSIVKEVFDLYFIRDIVDDELAKKIAEEIFNGQ